MTEADTNPAPEVSDEAAEERLASLFADESEPEAPDEDTAEGEESATEGEAENQPDDDAEEVEYEGKAYKVPKELKPAILRQADYTKKTQEVAAVRRQFEDKSMFVAAKEQLMNAASEDIAELRATEKELERFKALDWQQLHAADPAQAFALMQRQKQLEDTVADKRGKLGQMAQHAQKIVSEHRDKQWEIAAKAAYERLGKISKDDDDLLTREVYSAAADASEAKSRFADPQTLVWAFKAAKWDALQKAKPELNKKASEARPMKSASRSAPDAQRDSRAMQARQSLKKTGDTHAAEAYLESLFSRKK